MRYAKKVIVCWLSFIFGVMNPAIAQKKKHRFPEKALGNKVRY